MSTNQPDLAERIADASQEWLRRIEDRRDLPDVIRAVLRDAPELKQAVEAIEEAAQGMMTLSSDGADETFAGAHITLDDFIRDWPLLFTPFKTALAALDRLTGKDAT